MHKQLLAVGEALSGGSVVGVFLAVPGCQRQHHRNITDHGFNVGFAELVAVVVGGRERQTVTFLMLQQIPYRGQHHLGVTKAGRLDDIDLADLVVTHRVQNGNLKRQGFPPAFVVARFRRQVKVFVGPFHGGHGWRAV